MYDGWNVLYFYEYIIWIIYVQKGFPVCVSFSRTALFRIFFFLTAELDPAHVKKNKKKNGRSEERLLASLARQKKKNTSFYALVKLLYG